MDICTTTSTRGTTLLPRVAASPLPADFARPSATSLRIAGSALAEAPRWRGPALPCGPTTQPFTASTQGGAVAATDAAPVTDHAVIDLMVTDHPYSTRLGPFSCRPPV